MLLIFLSAGGTILGALLFFCIPRSWCYLNLPTTGVRRRWWLNRLSRSDGNSER
jgi:hypothetical protein